MSDSRDQEQKLAEKWHDVLHGDKKPNFYNPFAGPTMEELQSRIAELEAACEGARENLTRIKTMTENDGVYIVATDGLAQLNAVLGEGNARIEGRARSDRPL